MALSLGLVTWLGGLLVAAGIGYRIGLARGRRRERRAQRLQDRLEAAVTDDARRPSLLRQVEHRARTAPRPTVRREL